MLTKILTVASIVVISNAVKYRATFGGTNKVSGTVTVDDGKVMVDIDLSQMPDLPTNFSFCTAGGMAYHIHELWTYSPDNTDRFGKDACGATYTSGHYDPWNACGSASASKYCNKSAATATSTQCIPASAYTANLNYATNPFSAEVGDWSAKYGKLQLDSSNKLTTSKESFWEVIPEEVGSKSVVFHCNNGDRAFCAPFVATNDATTVVPNQDDTKTVVATFDVLSTDSMIKLAPNGDVTGKLDASSKGDAGTDCSTFEYSVFEAGTTALTSSAYRTACADKVGAQYDPTNSCLPWSKSPYCTTGKLCNDAAYSYACDAGTNRYSCAPGDLSGKIGKLSATTSLPINEQGLTLIPPTDSLIGKVIAITCPYADSSTIKYLACAPIKEYEDGIAQISFMMAFVVSFVALLY